MEVSPLPMLKAMLPKIPLVGKTAISHTLGLSPHAKHWDLRTELTISILRSFIVDSPPEPISKIQKLSLRDPGVKGRIWISRITMPVPAEDDVRKALFQAIEETANPGEATDAFTLPEIVPVEAEWTGYRAGATKQSVELSGIGEEGKYREMMKEVEKPTTVLYFHGGAYYLMDPISHRATCKKLAKLTHGRCLSIRYRLAPQHPFPSALLDALLSYLTLIYPPPGSFHTPVLPTNIIFAGDSAGGNLSLVLLHTILSLRRLNRKVLWHGAERDVPLPAGIATCSPWCDITHSSPSCETNKIYDYLPARSVHPSGMVFPPDNIWPTTPPRRNLYAEDAMLTHPLVSPLSAPATLWAGSPPLYISVGQELLTDEGRYVASLAARAGVTVVFEEYETMPHCFAMVLETLPASRRFFSSWAGFMSAAVERAGTLTTKGTVVKPVTLEEVSVDVKDVGTMTGEQMTANMRESVKRLSGAQPDTMSKL